MGSNPRNVRKPDIQPPDFVRAALEAGFRRFVTRIRTLRFSLLTGRVEMSDTTTTIETSENDDGRR